MTEQSVKSIVSSISLTPVDNKPKNITFVVDESGSTGSFFVPGITVLEKEMSIVYEYILKNPDNNYNLFMFETKCQEHKITVLKSEGMVNLPDTHPKGGTNTVLPLIEINKKLVKPDTVILLTDGETNSSQFDLKREVEEFNKKKIRLEIIAVSSKSCDLNTISQSEEQRIPGMDLVNYLSNSVSKLLVYNPTHKDVPYEGASSSKVNIKSLTFMGIPVEGHVHEFINKLLEKLTENKGSINWGIQNMHYKQLASEIGKLLSVYFVTFPSQHYFVNTIISKMLSICEIPDMTSERINSIIKYGFECTKNEKPIMYTNFEHHVKEKTVKRAEFANAIDSLKISGSTLGSDKTICMPTKGVCIINNNVIPMTKYLGFYPKSADEFENYYFDCGDSINEQATRIAFRELCSKIGYRDNRGPEPAFYVLNEMSLMYIKGVKLDTEHMILLKRLAIVQTSMEAMISKDKYDGIGLYKQWKSGKTLPVHYLTPTKFHSSLYKDTKINPLKLEEPIWWALMMSMLGLFDEQLNTYSTALSALNVNTKEDFLTWIQEKYSDKVQGTINLYTCFPKPTSVFTLEEFEPTDSVYVMTKHGTCDTKTHYSKTEIENFVSNSGCVWCRYKPVWDDFVQVSNNSKNQIEEIKQLMEKSSKLCVPIDSVDSLNLGGTENKKILINMIGITGAGKSTVSKKIYDYVLSKGGSCLIVSADKWSKRGAKGKQLQSSINKEIKDFDKSNEEYKVLVVDICNESGPSTNCFGFDTSEYSSYNFYPNLDKGQIDNYQCWCLQNVLSRPLHTDTSSYWLNPESAGVGTCIRVHNMKFAGLRKLLGLSSSLTFGEGVSKEVVMNLIKDKASQYETYLAMKDLDSEVETFVKSCGFVL